MVICITTVGENIFEAKVLYKCYEYVKIFTDINKAIAWVKEREKELNSKRSGGDV